MYEEVLEEGRGPKVPRSKGPKVPGSKGPRYLKFIFKYELDSKEVIIEDMIITGKSEVIDFIRYY